MTHQDSSLADAVRRGLAAELAAALQAARADTLATFAAWQQALPELRVPYRPELNLPLWELGHIGWFQSRWIARNVQHRLGHRADPTAPMMPAQRADADALYDSTNVQHASRWTLDLPHADRTRADLQAGLAQTLDLLDRTDGSADALYFFRLVLLHEDMHHEAALYMARGLGITIDDERWQPRALPAPPAALHLNGGEWTLGSATNTLDSAFAFDNELGLQPVLLQPFTIDAQALRWREFLPFVDDGGYVNHAHWTGDGRQWLAASQAVGPQGLRCIDGQWQRREGGTWQALDLDQAATHLTAHEAHAWCRWAGRRLPTEAEWDCAALTHPSAFRWGDVWEWTATPFAPFPGFEPHPYREYSAPWFDGRPVLRGASHLTQPRMRHVRYRNFFGANRNDIAAGFRSCTIG